MKIGVLYPRSKAHPRIMADFVDGLRTALKHKGLNNEMELLTESIGYGGVEKEVYEKAEKLLSLDGADVLVAYIDLRVIPILGPLLQATGKLMIVINPGANYPENWVPQPNIIYLTLQHSFLCWLTGSMASNVQNKDAVIATTFYDGGYLHIAALTKSYMNNGGNICFNYINNDLYNDSFQIKPLIDFLNSHKDITNLLCVFDTKPAQLFYERLNKSEESSRLNLFVSPMMLEQLAWKEAGVGFNFPITGYLPYHAASENRSNSEFSNIFTIQTKREVSVFALQGWEAALILQEIFNHFKGQYDDGNSIIEHLTTTVIESPRGNLKLDKDTNYFMAPVYKGTIKNNSTDMLITPAENIEEEWEKFVSDPVTGPSSGWTNTYLCY